jgi:hypothetical protein
MAIIAGLDWSPSLHFAHHIVPNTNAPGLSHEYFKMDELSIVACPLHPR